LVYDIELQKIRNRLAKLDVKNIPNDLSISLGNLAISPLKMAQIYTIFSNYGHMIEPRLVSKIVSKYNSVLFETRPKEILNFTKPEQAYLMTTILEDVIKRGTGKNANVDGIELAGKTGTTNSYIDAWFCGYSPTITTIVWYGRDKYKPIKKGATGGKVAAPAFAKFYQKLLKINPNIERKFKIPNGVFVGEIDGHEEYYTSISPLPQNDPNADIFEESANIPGVFKQDNNNSKPKSSSNVEVIKDDEDSTVITPIEIDETIIDENGQSELQDSEDVEVLY
jgi:penicillin-binding protein 1A